MTGEHLDDPDAMVTLAEAVQNRISLQSVSFSGQDGIFSWDEATQTGSLSLHPGQDFRGKLTASFTFDARSYSVELDLSYSIDCEAYLSLVTERGDEFASGINMDHNPLSGTVWLYTWDTASGNYVGTQLSSEQIQELSLESEIVTLTKEGQTVTITPLDGEAGDFRIAYDYGAPSGRPAEFSCTVLPENQVEETWRASVNYENTPYEIEFLIDGPDETIMMYGQRGGMSYGPDMPAGFEQTIGVGLTSRKYPDDEMNSERVQAPPDVQSLFSVESLSFEGRNEDGSTDNPNWHLSYGNGNRSVTFTAEDKAGFSGTLTAVCRFNGQSYPIQTDVFYSRPEDRLAFRTTDGEEMRDIELRPGTSVTGSFLLCQYVDSTNSFSSTSLDYAQHESIYIMWGNEVASLSYGEETPFTCGVLVYCSGRTAESSIYSIESCSFSGFQYAIRGTGRAPKPDGRTGTDSKARAAAGTSAAAAGRVGSFRTA